MIKTIKIFNSYSLVCLVLILPFSSALSNLLFAIFCATSIIEYFLNNESYKSNNILYIFIFFLFYISIIGLFQGSYDANKSLWKFLPILLIGSLLIYTKKDLPINRIEKISIISCAFYVLICVIRTSLFYYKNSFIPFANEGEMVHILKIHRPYLGFYVLLNILLCFKFTLNSFQKRLKIIYSIIILFMFAFLVLISARLSIISFIIITLIYIIFYLNLNFVNKSIIGALATLGLTFLVLSNPNVKERLNYDNLEILIDQEPRFVIWKSVYNIKNNQDFNNIIGYGNYQLIEDYLVINYEQIINKKEKKDYFINEKFNTHSQFYDYLLFGGYIALFIFTTFCIMSLLITKGNFISFSIIVSFILFFSVENVFHRQLGCYLFIIYYIISLKRINTLSINNI
ncbi:MULTISPECIES: O-antigen ligase family protein [unclassified Empedobacter]|uniref:O-antigen ligase family protein n=2 Tax=Empedobacter TaxID=59734 RepID=UPI002449E001|nr:MULTISPECIES: O-antigen ligase family protein [unclassified Empedobacter]MDH0659056.1 O-antigen ligase family protein [Empedobacter sp. GD03865]